jgi:diguanylate cyclase
MWRNFRTSDVGLWVMTAVGGLLLLSIGTGFTYLLDEQQRIRVRGELGARTAGAAQAIERQLTASFSATNMLAALVRQGNGRVAGFGEIAPEIQRQFPGVGTLALAPDGVVRAVYPPDSTGAPAGLDILDDPQRRGGAIAALRSRTATLTGPLDIDGYGNAMIARQPVFMRRNGSVDEQFWGFVVVVVNLPELLRGAHLADTLGSDIAYRLTRPGNAAGETVDILQSEPGRLHQPVQAAIVVPGGQWLLEAVPTAGWSNMFGRIEFWGMLLAVAVGSGMFHLLLRQQRSLAEMALYDPLTGLANRAHFRERAAFALNHARRHGLHLAVLFIDLDGFKLINDRHGHDIGDVLLREIAQRMLANVRNVDTVARVGGDEFVVVLSGLASTAEHEGVRTKLESVLRRPHVVNGRRLRVGVSLGASVYPDHGETLEELIAQADRSMYRSKRHSGARVQAD